jgi:hypothetical protein
MDFVRISTLGGHDTGSSSWTAIQGQAVRNPKGQTRSIHRWNPRVRSRNYPLLNIPPYMVPRVGIEPTRLEEWT